MQYMFFKCQNKTKLYKLYETHKCKHRVNKYDLHQTLPIRSKFERFKAV